MEAEDKLRRFEETLRRILREEIENIGRQVVREEVRQLSLFKKPKIDLVGGKWIGITEEQRESWSAAYGAVDLEAELKRAAAWCVSNPDLAPKSQKGRFLNTWMTRCQDRAALKSIPTSRPAEIKQKHCEYCPKIATGSVGGLWHCPDHRDEAYDRKPRAHMLGVVAKPVAGVD